jgi:antitoxin component of MazEF toxin-antitoxin module
VKARNQRLHKIGNSYGLLIPSPVRQLLNFTRDTSLKMSLSPDGRGLVITPAAAPERKRGAS